MDDKDLTYGINEDDGKNPVDLSPVLPGSLRHPTSPALALNSSASEINDWDFNARYEYLRKCVAELLAGVPASELRADEGEFRYHTGDERPRLCSS